MQKLFSFFALILVVLGLSITPAFAVSPETLTQIAENFPAETPILVVFNIDDQMLDKWDSISQRFISIFPSIAEDVDGRNIKDILDEGVRSIDPNGDFDTTVRPWLGDFAAMGLYSPEKRTPDVIFVMEITDRGAAREFFIGSITQSDVEYTLVQGDEYDQITPQVDDNPGEIFIYDDRLVVYAMEEVIAITDTLAANPKFQDAAARLSFSTYDVSLYLDMAFLQEYDSTLASDRAFAELFTSYEGGLFMAFGVEGETQFVLDYAVPTPSSATLESVGIQYNPPTPIDTTLARFIPADAVFYTQANNLEQALTESVENMITLMRRQAISEYEAQELDDMLRFVPQLAQQFTAYTELEFSEDVLGWMTGNYGLFARLRAEEITRGADPTTLISAFEVGFITEATDPEAAQLAARNMAQGLHRFVRVAAGNNSPDPEFSVGEDLIGDVTVNVFSIRSVSDGLSIDLVFAANDEIFFIGTRSAAESVFLQQNPLSESEKYAQTLALSLENPVNLFLFNGDGIARLIESIAASQNLVIEEEEEVAELYAFLQNLDIVAASSSIDGDIMLGRFIFTLTDPQ